MRGLVGFVALVATVYIFWITYKYFKSKYWKEGSDD